jgi:hypothetical protein
MACLTEEGLEVAGRVLRDDKLRSEKELDMLAREFRTARASRKAAALILEEGLLGRLILAMEGGREGFVGVGLR